ncbi:MAG: NAD(P)-dependent alcohol dehydrogenase [Balneolaceae bacterium]|nr:NAD(P)-dependent alcohol dehydrogenase [Balneolaceae bacterium]
MKSIQYKTYGGPEALKVVETEKPSPNQDEILVKVFATTVTSVDSTFRGGKALAARLYIGIRNPKNPILGTEFSGIVEKVGKRITSFKTGDRIFGEAEGTYAEYLVVKENTVIAKIPENLSFKEAAAIPYGVLTALPFLRDTGSIKKGDKVLVNGASGSVGSYGVLLAKYYGAEVTGVCSTTNVEMVQSLGADRVIDYKKEDFTKSGEKWDIIFDAVGKSSFSKSKSALTGHGIYLTTVMSATIQFDMLRTSFTSPKAKLTLTGMRKTEEKQKDLHFIRGLIEEGTIKPYIDREYPFEEISEAHSYVESGHKTGNVVINVNQ